MCARRACAATLDVTSLGPSGGRLRHIIAAHDYYDYFPIDIDATLENGNELVGRWRAIWIKVRLRPDGNVDILRWWDGTPMPRSGVLSRVE